MAKKKSKKVGNIPKGTANATLRKKIIFHLLENINKNTCYICNEPIKSSSDMSIIHMENWHDDTDLYWDINNIAFGHLDCASGATKGAAQQKEKNMLVDIQLVDTNGKQLPTYFHDGQIYLAGKTKQAYNIKITNKSCHRLETVVTVDGRDVISGEEGDISNNGYVISPFGSTTIKGFRKSHDKVAAFKFAKPNQSYSAKMGTPENVGVIGVAAFVEKQQFVFLNYNYPTYYWWGKNYLNGYSITCNSTPIGNLSCNSGVTYDGAPATYTSSSTSINCSTEVSSTPEMNYNAEVSSIGTEYGSTLSSKVTETHFTRQNPSCPDEVYQLLYDTKEGLRTRGIPVDKPKAPQAFPKSPEVFSKRKFAQPPPK